MNKELIQFNLRNRQEEKLDEMYRILIEHIANAKK